VKATATPDRGHNRHLEWLQAEQGNAFLTGILFTANPQPIQLTERVMALPIAALWS